MSCQPILAAAGCLLFLGADAGAPSRGLDPHNCGPVQVVSPLAGELAAVAFSPDGRLCAVGGTGGVVRVYDAARWREEREIKLGEKVAALVFLPDGKRLVAAGELSIRILRAAEGTEIARFNPAFGATRSLALSADGRSLLSVHASGRSGFWDVEACVSTAVVPEEKMTAVSGAFTRTEERAAIGGAGGAQIRTHKGGDWPVERIVELEEDSAASLAFSRDDRWLLLGRGGGIVTVWSLDKGAAERALQGHQGMVRTLAVTPDDRTAITGADDGTIRLWDWRKGAELSQLKHPGVRAVALHPSGRMFASVGTDRQLRVWGYVRGGEARLRGKGFCGVSLQKSGGAVVIFSVVPGGPAEQAGLKEGDVVRVIGTKAVKEPSDALEALGSYGDGEEAVFEIERKGEERQVRVRLGKKPGAKEKQP